MAAQLVDLHNERQSRLKHLPKGLAEVRLEALAIIRYRHEGHDCCDLAVEMWVAGMIRKQLVMLVSAIGVLPNSGSSLARGAPHHATAAVAMRASARQCAARKSQARGPSARVLSPPEVVASVKREAEALALRYAEG